FIPNTEIFRGMVDTDEGWIITNEKMQTSCEGVYAAGDVRVTPLRQVITAAADGAVAAYYAKEYISAGSGDEN
ncbi:MAG: FAD-dependent oxidoreductase, partial [Eubacteriaceae bacterium]|nr:FAD-dependent oxidoreductase [Eubacteriaceae bacterium]